MKNFIDFIISLIAIIGLFPLIIIIGMVIYIATGSLSCLFKVDWI